LKAFYEAITAAIASRGAAHGFIDPVGGMFHPDTGDAPAAKRMGHGLLRDTALTGSFRGKLAKKSSRIRIIRCIFKPCAGSGTNLHHRPDGTNTRMEWK
jgi:hypothetical protein